VKLWETLFRFIRDYHPLGFIFRRLQKSLKIKEDEELYALIDAWVHLHLFLAIILWVAVSIIDSVVWLIWFFVIYGILRISYIVIYNINVILFDQFQRNGLKKNYMVRSYRRILICLFINYAEIILWFAIFYCFLKHCFSMSYVCLNNPMGSLYFSIVTMTTLGYGDIKPINNWGAFLCGFQTLIGVFWIAVVVARFITVLPKAQTRDPDETKQK
jgi:hypothetical protein